jgi:uncharacterized membrane protein YeaQ/YmgE (transglycosylase-associated protein family)
MYLSTKNLWIGRSCCRISDIIIETIGAFTGDWLLPQPGIHLGTGATGAIIDTTIGATAMLLITKLGRGGPCQV